MRNFTTHLIIAALSASSAMAQLPQACFFLTHMEGNITEDSDLISNLPDLEKSYRPGMQLKTIIAMQDPEMDGRITGLQVDLVEPETRDLLKLPLVGVEPDEWESNEMIFKAYQPDKISILTDTTEGSICDVIIYHGKDATNLSNVNDVNCNPEELGIEETIVRLPEETPLVGFHGHSDGLVLNSLGLILVNAADPACQQASSHGQIEIYRGSIFEQSTAAEEAITKKEMAKTQELEAIIAYDTIAQARESKEQIHQQIAELNFRMPTEGLEKPENAGMLKDMLDRMAEVDMRSNPRTNHGLDKLLNLVTQHMKKAVTQMPFNVAQLQFVQKELAIQDGTLYQNLSGRVASEPATSHDLVTLIQALRHHLNTSKARPNQQLDLSNSETKSLADIFSRLEEKYADEDKDQELWLAFDQLAEVFGHQSDFEVSKKEAEELYNKLHANERLDQKFEGHQIGSLEDLGQIAREQSLTVIEELRGELEEFEMLEDENMEYLEENYDLEGDEIDDILTLLEQDSTRLSQMEKLLIDLQKREQVQGSSEKELPIPPYILKDAVTGDAEKAADAIDKIGHMLQERASIAEEVRNDSQKITEAEAKFQEDTDKMVLAVVGGIVFAIIIGMALGSCIVLCCLKRYQKDQSKRLKKAQHHDLVFVEGSRTIDMPTLPNNPIRKDSGENSTSMEQPQNPIPTEEKASGKFQMANVLDTEEMREDAKKQRQNETVKMPNVHAMDDDTFDDSAEDKDEDFVNVLTTRGLKYDAPKARQGTMRHLPVQKKAETEVKDDEEKQEP